jgi:hypothetical protein
MTSLSETYGARGSRARKRLLAGTALFLLGALMIVVGIVIGSTDVLAAYDVGTFEAREMAGTLGGLGVPAVFVGVFTVLPASRGKRAAAGIGAAIAIIGVVLFLYAYPEQWSRASGSPETNLTLPVATVYAAGVFTTFWALFTAIVNVKARSPGGNVTLQRIIRRAAGSPNAGSHRPGSKPSGSKGGSVGVAGGLGTDTATTTEPGTASDGGTEAEPLRTPEPSTDPAGAGAETTGRGNDSTGAGAGTTGRGNDSTGAGAGTTGRGNDSTGGPSGSTDSTTPLDAGGTTGGSDAEPDRYCGNCTHFRYVRADAAMQPYCGFHDELMDDMEACEAWEANTLSGETYNYD